jgi:hypothetical protein
MAAEPKRALDIETIWIRQYARAYLPNETGFSFSAEMLRREGVTLIDVRNVFRKGVVTYADKLNDPGAIWVVEGEDVDGRPLRITVIVVSEILEVRLKKLERVVAKAKVQERPNDAA